MYNGVYIKHVCTHMFDPFLFWRPMLTHPYPSPADLIADRFGRARVKRFAGGETEDLPSFFMVKMWFHGFLIGNRWIHGVEMVFNYV